MLSRRFIRVKVLQALYAYFLDVDNDLPAGEKLLIKNIHRTFELYINVLSFLVELHDFYQKRVEEAMQKHFPSDEELNPNTRFINNRAIKILIDSRDFQKKCRDFKPTWSDETEMLRVLYFELKASSDYQDYMSSPLNTFNEDRNFLIKIVQHLLFPSAALQGYFEEKNIYWADDYDTALTLVISTIKSLRQDQDNLTPLPDMFGNAEDESEDLMFARDLFRKTIIHSGEFSEYISSKAENWEIDRIALIDVILLKMAIAELLHMSSIPIKVTLNEYIEIAKQYSTPKSKIFINGILDKLILQFNEKSLLHKSGRGLINN